MSTKPRTSGEVSSSVLDRLLDDDKAKAEAKALEDFQAAADQHRKEFGLRKSQNLLDWNHFATEDAEAPAPVDHAALHERIRGAGRNGTAPQGTPATKPKPKEDKPSDKAEYAVAELKPMQQVEDPGEKIQLKPIPRDTLAEPEIPRREKSEAEEKNPRMTDLIMGKLPASDSRAATVVNLKRVPPPKEPSASGAASADAPTKIEPRPTEPVVLPKRSWALPILLLLGACAAGAVVWYFASSTTPTATKPTASAITSATVAPDATQTAAPAPTIATATADTTPTITTSAPPPSATTSTPVASSTPPATTTSAAKTAPKPTGTPKPTVTIPPIPTPTLTATSSTKPWVTD